MDPKNLSKSIKNVFRRGLKNESQKGKPVFGICNGAQILVESGLVPGVIDNKIGVSLADNKRIQNGYVVGTGYYNEWTYLKTSVSSQSTAFTKYLKKDELIHVPFAHAEGRFIIPKILLDELIKNEQTPFPVSYTHLTLPTILLV